jgi:hypothetical protein
MSPKWTWRIFLTGEETPEAPESKLLELFLELAMSLARDPGEALRSSGKSGTDDGGPDILIVFDHVSYQEARKRPRSRLSDVGESMQGVVG